jgi:WD40 repeat protein/serine/threonine protein kinase
MENCPYCDAPGSYREATDGSCYVCGMMLPTQSGKGEPATVGTAAQAADEVVEAGTHEEATVLLEPSAPTVTGDTTDVAAIQLIQPRNLSPEYARRVTAAWQGATKSPFKNPLETINSRAGQPEGGDQSNLLIGSRSVGKPGDQQRPDYELIEEIGAGNMGTVYLARQSSLDRKVAIKMPKPYASTSPLGRQLFISEVVVTGQLDHPNIVPIYDLARDEAGQLFYAMKRVEGKSWDECMVEKGRTRHDNVEILMKVCDAIRFAHDRKVIHRDIKPQNIMVGKYGEVSVMDWGIAMRLPEGTNVPGMAKINPSGTPAYMAPEMATGNANEIGPHTDVYLLGAVLYEIITGEPPHPAPKQTNDPYVQQKACLLIAARNVITPANETGELVDIAYKAMATDIYDRYATVDEFQSAIRDYFAHAESIALTDRGEQHLKNAREMKNGVYEDYNKARFAFEEAVQLWPENSKARSGAAQATLDHAGSALKRGDYALGLSLLDAENPTHGDLYKKLRTSQRRSRRSRLVAAATAIALVIVLGAFTTFGTVMWRLLAHKSGELKDLQKVKDGLDQQVATVRAEIKDADRKVEEAKKTADKEIQTAKTAAQEQIKVAAVEAQKRIDVANQDAQQKISTANNAAQMEIARANQAKDVANQEVARASSARQKADYKLGIADALDATKDNSFEIARDKLQKLRSDDASQKTHLIGWEWGHLMHLAKGPSLQLHIDGSPRVDQVALSPNGKWIAAGAMDKNVHIWWRADLKKPHTLVTPAPVSAIAISYDNKLLAAAAADQVYFWKLPPDGAQPEFASAGVLKLPLANKDQIRSVCFSPTDSNVVLTTAADSAQLLLRDKPNDAPRYLKGHIEGTLVWQARFSHDGQQIVTAGDDGTVRVWQTQTLQSRLLDGHQGPVYVAEFSPDGRYIVSGGSDRRLLVWDVPKINDAKSTSVEIRARLGSLDDKADQFAQQLGSGVGHTASIRAISFSPDQKMLFSGSTDNTVGVWDISGGLPAAKLAKTLRGHGGWVRSCVADADGKHVLSGSDAGEVFLWDWQNYTFPLVLTSEAQRSQSLTSAAASPDGKWIATGDENGAVSMWNIKNLNVPKLHQLTEGHDWQATTGVYFNNGTRLLTAAGDNSTAVWDAATGNQLLHIGGRSALVGTGWRGVAAASYDGRWIATGSWLAKSRQNRNRGDIYDASGERDLLAIIWDATTGAKVDAVTIKHTDQHRGDEPSSATAIAFSPKNDLLFVGDQYGKCYLYNTKSRSLSQFTGHAKKVIAAGFVASDNGEQRLLTASSDIATSVALWNLSDLQRPNAKPVLFEHHDRVTSLDISADGTYFITASGPIDAKAIIRLWNTRSGKCERSIALKDLESLVDGVRREQSRHTMLRVKARGTAPVKNVLEVRSVALDRKNTEAMATLFDPDTSEYHVAKWTLTNGGGLQLVAKHLHDTSTAIYAPNLDKGILTVGGRGARLRLANTTKVTMNFRSPNRIESVAFSPSGRLIAAAGADGSINVWRYSDSPNGGQWMKVDKWIGDAGPISSIAFHPVRDDALLTAGPEGTKLWRPVGDRWQPTSLQDLQRNPVRGLQQAIFSPADENKSSKVYGAVGGNIIVWREDGTSERTVKLPAAAGEAVQCLAVSPNRKWLVAAMRNRFVVCDDAAQNLVANATDNAEITAITFSSDGERLFTTNKMGVVKVWDASAWQNIGAGKSLTLSELLKFQEHERGKSIRSASFFKNEKYPCLLTAGEDGKTVLWPSEEWR